MIVGPPTSTVSRVAGAISANTNSDFLNSASPRTGNPAEILKEPVFGLLGMIEELGRTRLQDQPGSLYPILHELERRGYLRVSLVRNNKSLRRFWAACAKRKTR
jgi:hypothetical protein